MKEEDRTKQSHKNKAIFLMLHENNRRSCKARNTGLTHSFKSSGKLILYKNEKNHHRIKQS